MEPGARSRAVARAVAVAAALTGATVLAGWATGRHPLTFGFDIWMKPNAAVCFVLLGAALWRTAGRSRTAPDRIAIVLASVAALLGALTVLEHLFGLDLHIDQALFSEPPGMPATAAPGRMGPPASTSFLVLGTALAMLRSRAFAARAVVQALALAAAFIALLPLVGYAYRTSELYGVAFTGIALSTALMLEALAVAVLLVTPSGLASTVRDAGGAGRLARRALLYSTVIPLAVGWAVAQGLHRRLYDGDVAISFLVLSLILALALLAWRDAVHIARMDDARRLSEERARARAVELQAVLDAFPVAVFIIRGRDATRLETNRFGSELLRLRPGESIARAAPGKESYRVLRDGREVPPEEHPAQLVATRGVEVRDWECELAFRDGTSVHILGNAAPIADEHGQLAGSVSAYVDITQRVKAERDLREADRRKDEFLAVLSHELRNPLAPIRNSLFLLDRAEVGTEQARRAQAVIGRQVSHLTRLVEDLLDVSRISRGKVQLQRARVDVAELVRRTAEDHRGAAIGAGIDVDVETPDRSLWVNGDPTRLAQIVGNLVANAIKFTPAGGRMLVAAERDGDRTAVLRVRDTGVGMDAAMLARLFEPFVQADQTLDRTRGGLGLGLALVRGLAELHGGTVEARSDGAGRGAEFLVRLPLEPPPEPVTTREASPSAAPPLRIVIVEDNVDAAETLREALEMMGHAVEIVHDGEEGVAKARASRPDVVLCDIGLPGIDGYDVARALRADAVTRGTVLIAVTGYASPEDQWRAAEAGFDHHFAKPADLTRLMAILLDVSRTLGASPARPA